MLIKCPECGKEISDKAPACIHCGYPLQESELKNKSDFYTVILTNTGINKVKIIKIIREITGLGLKEAKEFADFPPQTIARRINFDDAKMLEKIFEIEGATVSIEEDVSSIVGDDIHDILISILQNQSVTKPIKKVNANTPVTCPKCGSTQIQVVRKKFSLLTGFATNKVERVCANCLHKF